MKNLGGSAADHKGTGSAGAAAAAAALSGAVEKAIGSAGAKTAESADAKMADAVESAAFWTTGDQGGARFEIERKYAFVSTLF